MRHDRKSAALGRKAVVPGSSENRFLYHRISGTAYGMQMPPTCPLRADQIEVLRTWIDQGAVWPHSLANEADLPPVNPKAVAVVEALRTGDQRAFDKAVADDSKLLNARGPEGSAPFMYAVLYAGRRHLGKAAETRRRSQREE